jgi:pimeloyl-ACP methyl ester carboxylesterase
VIRADALSFRFDHRDTGRSDCVDFSANPYTLAVMAADTLAVLDGHGIDRAHVVGLFLGGAIGQWLAVHHAARVRTLTTIMTSPMGNNAGPAWTRAMAGQPAAPNELPPPVPRFLRHVMESAQVPGARVGGAVHDRRGTNVGVGSSGAARAGPRAWLVPG